MLGWKKLGLERSLGTRLVIYADDLVILCRKGNAEAALHHLRAIMGKLKLTANEDKTRICTVPEGDGELSTFCAIADRDEGQLAQKFAAEGELVGAMAVGEETVMADAVKPIGQCVQQKAADKLVSRERHHLVLVDRCPCCGGRMEQVGVVPRTAAVNSSTAHDSS